MKKIFAGIAFLGLVAFASAQTITFDREVVDYGSIAKGSNGERVFTFTNTGDKPLILSDVQPGCGCTVLENWTKEPIAPGKTGIITAKYDTQKVGGFAKTITVSSNDPANGKKTLHLKGNVEGATTATTQEAQVIPATSAGTRATTSGQKMEVRAEAKRAMEAPITTIAPATAAAAVAEPIAK
jgi:hypothetical protein